MSNSAMSNETDLDWLARNVHAWPFALQSYIYVITASDGMKSWGGNVFVQVNKYRRFDKEEWLARRAELQNKPGWANHQFPQIFQNEDGHWFGARDEWDFKAHIGGGWKGDGVSLLRDDGEYLQSGEILGNWRDTLERRPADLSEPAVTERLAEATQNVLAAVPALKDEKYRFEWEPKPADVHKTGSEIDTSAERVQKSAKSMHDWHESGELPPVGTECEAATEGCDYEKCEILAFHKGQVALRWFEFNGGCLDVLELDGWTFRPIRTERDVLIDIIRGAAHPLDTVDVRVAHDALADAILAAGFKMGAK